MIIKLIIICLSLQVPSGHFCLCFKLLGCHYQLFIQSFIIICSSPRWSLSVYILNCFVIIICLYFKLLGGHYLFITSPMLKYRAQFAVGSCDDSLTFVLYYLSCPKTAVHLLINKEVHKKYWILFYRLTAVEFLL